MIFKRLKVIGVWMLLGILTPLWSNCPLTLTNAKVSPAPLEYKKEGSVTFHISEVKGSKIPAKDIFAEATCQFMVDLNKIVPKDYNLSFIKGEINTYFDFTYNAKGNQVYFVQKLDIPAKTVIELVIPVDVTLQSPSTNPFNGFITNMHASSESIDKYVSTKKAILLAVSDHNSDTINGDAGGIAIRSITMNDTINDTNVTLGVDVNIASVSNNTPLVIDKTTGKVTVPEDTKAGTYTETYTICETYDPTNCSDANIEVVVNGMVDAPVITMIDGDESSQQSITTDTMPRIDGTCEANLTVGIRIDGTEIAPIVSCENNGTFSFTPEHNIMDGEHNITAVQKDGDETSATSNVQLLIVE